MNKNLLQQVLGVMFFNMCGLALAQSPTDSIALNAPLTYEQCVEYALSHNIELQQSVLARRSSQFDLEQAKAQWLPTLNFATSQTYANYPHPANNSIVCNFCIISNTLKFVFIFNLGFFFNP